MLNVFPTRTDGRSIQAGTPVTCGGAARRRWDQSVHLRGAELSCASNDAPCGDGARAHMRMQQAPYVPENQ